MNLKFKFNDHSSQLSIERIDEEKQRLIKEKQMLRDKWQEQIDEKQKQVNRILYNS